MSTDTAPDTAPDTSTRTSSASPAARTMVIWCPDWPAVAAATEAGLGRAAPLAVLHGHQVLACNAAARADGVRRGMRRRDAQSRCPELTVVPGNPDRDIRLFEPVVALLEELRPGVALLRPGLVALSVPSGYYGGEDEAAATFAERLVAHGVWDVRFGIADEVFTAEHAARRAPIQQCRVVPPGGAADFLADLPIEVLADGAAGRELVGLLRRLGIRWVGEFAALPPAGVAARFGGHGAGVHQLLRGRTTRGWAPRTPTPDRICAIDFEPGITSIETVCFSVRQTAETFVAGLASQHLVCTEVQVEAETDRGTVSGRTWAHTNWFGATDLVDRVRWQLQAAGRSELLDGPIVRVRFEPITVEPSSAHAEALWGSGSDERVERGVAKVQAMLGHEAVVRPVRQGGRGAMDRQILVPWGEKATGARAADRPWPGSLPGPAPTRVFAEPTPAGVVDQAGHPIRLTDRGVLTGHPARFRTGTDQQWQPVLSWAGPWPVDERWWAEDSAGLVARCQVVGAEGRAWLLRHDEVNGWRTEASYD